VYLGKRGRLRPRRSSLRPEREITKGLWHSLPSEKASEGAPPVSREAPIVRRSPSQKEPSLLRPSKITREHERIRPPRGRNIIDRLKGGRGSGRGTTRIERKKNRCTDGCRAGPLWELPKKGESGKGVAALRGENRRCGRRGRWGGFRKGGSQGLGATKRITNPN